MLAHKSTPAAQQALGTLSHRVLPSTASTAARLSQTKDQKKGFATVGDAPPKRVYGGLRDQDRIFTNLYGHHGADLKSAMKYGDWHNTKAILDKGHDWVCTHIQWRGERHGEQKAIGNGLT
jgi:NADH dehydrogenase (ubiquinone) flavoprotein 1